VCIVLLVNGAIFASLVFSYLYLSMGATQGWPPRGTAIPGLSSSALAATAWIASSFAISLGNRALRADRRAALGGSLAVGVGLAALAMHLTAQAVAGTGARPDVHAFGATAHALLAWQGLHATLLAVMGIYTLARAWAGRLDSRRRGSFDHTRLLWHYTVLQALILLLLLQSARIH
jgi:cytochrome c oxidase subunit I+III